jgi:transposase
MTSGEKKQEQARQRASVIMRVRGGRITASEGSEELGVSCKTYYEWERRALEGMMNGLESQSSGRPAEETDPEKESMSKKIEALEKELNLAKQSIHVRKILHAYELHRAKEAKKKEKDNLKKNRI